jgi:hypothetical protein
MKKKRSKNSLQLEKLRKEALALRRNLKLEIAETNRGIKQALKEKKITKKEFLTLEVRMKKVEEKFKKYKLPKVKK